MLGLNPFNNTGGLKSMIFELQSAGAENNDLLSFIDEDVEYDREDDEEVGTECMF